MRLDRLEVTGFGRVRDLTVDLDPRITVIHGPNESGKSTVHRAIRTGLYGIDAGGQGRPADRSEWQRWMPWSAGPYGVVLTYTLSDGRQLRSAHRLDNRQHRVQVHEIGGGDLTDSMRVGRTIAPGEIHFGIGEPVFCATAWLGEDGLRIDAPDGALARSENLQEALERIADSGRGVTSQRAIARLRDALDRVGSERRSSTPLGAAVIRLRQLEGDILAARRRAGAVAHDEERLRCLEAAAVTAEERRDECGRAWLVGRLAAIATARREIAAAVEDVNRLTPVVAANAAFAGFPVGDEATVMSLRGELHQATATGREAAARWQEVQSDLEHTCLRREEIAPGLTALRATGAIDTSVITRLRVLQRELDAEASPRRQRDDLRAAQARTSALRREIAATGLAGLPVGSVDVVAPLVSTAAAESQGIAAGSAALIAVAGGAGGMALLIAHRPLYATAIWLLAGALTVALAGRYRVRLGRAAEARRRLGRLYPSLELSPSGLSRARQRLPALRALHQELQRQEVMAGAHRHEFEAARRRAAELATATEGLAADALPELRPDRSRAEGEDDPDTLLDRAGRALAAVAAAVDDDRRATELAAEDERLARHEASLRALGQEAARRERKVAELGDALAGLLGNAGVAPDESAEVGVESFRAGCARRREYETAEAELAAARRRMAAVGADDDHLQRLAAQLEQQLRRRGGDPGAAAGAPPLSTAELQHLENEVEHASRSATSAAAEATALRARLAGQLEGLPSIADLEDERASCLAARDRGLHQIASLRRAITLIEEATRSVHRDLAPRLGASVSQRLDQLTEGRYRGVSVDAERFAVTLMGGERPELVPIDLVSHGTRDQVSLLLRLAIVEVLGDSGESIPLLLDEPLLSADPNRRAAGLDFLIAISARNQVVLTTSDPALAGSLRERGDAQISVVELPAPTAGVEVVGRAAVREPTASPGAAP